MSIALFYIFGVAAVACGLTMILVRNPVYSALYMIGCLIAVAGEFVLLDAPLLAALQVLVYAGAIMVLYLFVIMLLNLRDDPGFCWWTNWRTYIGFVLAALMGFAAVWKFLVRPPAGSEYTVFSTRQLAATMFTDPTQIMLIESLAVLLLMAVVGALYLGRKTDSEEQSPAVEGGE